MGRNYIVFLFCMICFARGISQNVVLDTTDHTHGSFRWLSEAAAEADMFGRLYRNNQDRLAIVERLSQFPSEGDNGSRDTSDGWKSIGPGFAYSDPPTNWNIRINTGRCVDVEWTPLGGLRALSASGGLFASSCAPPCADTFPDFSFTWRSISDNLNTLRGGAFATNPQNPNSVFLGTGEYGIQGGTGLFYTHDLGEHWQLASLSPFADAYFKIVFDPTDTNIIHCASNNGYYQSTNGGATFVRKLIGVISDIVVNPLNPSTIYATKIGAGYYRSNDKGLHWYLLPGAPNSELGRSRIDICPSDTNILYTTATTENSSYTGNKWFFRSQNAGASWDSCHMLWSCGGGACFNIYDNQEWYNNALGICPTECGTVLAGAVALTVGYTDSVNTNFQMQGLMAAGDEHHPDEHDIAWQTNVNPPIAWLANDGGIAYAQYPYIDFEGGEANNLPIFQIYDYSMVDNVELTQAFGTQDNKTIVNDADNGNIWQEVWGGDGTSVAVNPNEPFRIFMVNNSNLLYTETGGFDANFIGTPFYPRHVRYGSVGNPKVYICGFENDPSVDLDHCLFESSDNGGFWAQSNPTPFSRFIQTFAVGKGAVPNVYVALWPADNELDTADKLMVLDRVDGRWYERSAGLNTADRVENIIPDNIDPDIALLYMNNEQSRSQFDNIYFTTDRGQTWTNITGDLPDVRIRAGLIYPYDRNTIILGSIDGGCFITTTGGQNWIRWNKGMPAANIIQGFQSVDSVATEGKFWIYAATYGRSLWLRELHDSGFPYTGIKTATSEVPLELYASFSSDGNLIADYKLQESGNTLLELFGIDGRLDYTSAEAAQSKGIYETTVPAAGLPAGLYLLSLKSGTKHKTVKVVKF